jgi:uncharacterized repeat protein (TIGR02543 family)
MNLNYTKTKHKIRLAIIIALAFFSLSFTSSPATNETSNIVNMSSEVQVIAPALQGFVVKVYTPKSGAGASPSIDPSNLTLLRETTTITPGDTPNVLDAALSYAWGSNVVMSSGRTEQVIIHFSGYLNPTVTQLVEFTTDADDGVKIYMTDVNGNTNFFYDDWIDKGSGGIIRSYQLEIGKPVKIDFWFYENGGGAKVNFSWNIGSGFVLVPQNVITQTFPTKTITFESNGGNSISNLVGEVGKTFTMPSSPIRDGFVFDGWFTNSQLTTIFDATSFPSDNITLYAKWIELFSLRIKDFNNNILLEELLTSNTATSLTLPNPAVRDGYTFYGWSSAIPALMPAFDIDIYALYRKDFVTSDFSIGNTDKNYIGGSIIFEIDSNDPHSYYIFINDNQENTTVGVISRNGNNIYYGDGSTARKFAEVDAVLNGINGNDLKVNFTNSLDSAGVLIPGGDFVSLAGWTSFLAKYPTLTDNAFRNNTSPTYTINNTNQTLNLRIAVEFQQSGAQAHGPYVQSPVFSATAGQVLTFDYSAISPKGEYDIYVYLLKGNTSTQILYARGDEVTNAKFRYEINESAEDYRLVFVGGGFISGQGNDKNIDTTFSIDNVSLSQGVSSSLLVNSLIKSINLISSVQTLKFITFTTIDDTNTQTAYTLVTDNPVNQTTSIIENLNLNYQFLQDENIEINFNLGAYFLDTTSPITYQIVNSGPSNSFISINASNGQITGKGLNANVGLHNIIILASQNVGEITYYSDLITLQFEIVNVNDPVYFNQLYENPFAVEVSSLTSFTYQIPSDFFLDIDANDTKTYSFVETNLVCLTISPSGLITGLNCQQVDLVNPITVKVVDSGGVEASAQIKFGSGIIVSFQLNGGAINGAETISQQFINPGSTVTKPQDPLKTHYIFEGWYISTEYIELNKFNFDVPVDSNITLYANYYPAPYDIFYELYGGINAENNPSTYNIETESFLLISPEKIGYTFAGWYLNQNFTGSAVNEISFGSTGDVYLYASWTLNTYTITYLDLFEGQNDAENIATYTVITPSYNLKNPTRLGYTFNGWYYLSSGNQNPITQITIGSAGNLELYASWTLNTYTITYLDLFEGQNDAENIATYTVITPSYNLKNPTRLGYTFNGWYYLSSGNQNPITQITIGSAGNLELYASWTLNIYNIIYDNLLNGINPNSSLVDYTILTPTISLQPAQRIGYDFAGWFADAEYSGQVITSINQGSIGHVELFAKWVPIIYPIIYLDMLTTIGSNPVQYTIETSTINLQTNFTQTGYTFIGFFDNPEFNGLAITSIPQGSFGNKIFYANWVKAFFNLSFKDDKGGTISTQSVEYLTVVDTSFIPTTSKEGYEFLGWSDNLPSIMPAANVDVIARFKPLQFKLTIKDSFGNTILDEMFDFDAALSAITLEEVEIEGYEFESWSAPLPATMPASDLEIIGNYRELTKYKLIILGAKGEVLIEAEFKEKEVVTGITLPTIQNSDGFVFESWSDSLPEIMPANDITIKPLGTAINATIELFSADRTFITSIEAQVGESIFLPVPSRIGYSFAGWVDSSSASRNVSIMPSGNLSLFATWQAKTYTVLVSTGSLDYSINIVFGEPIGNIVQPQLFGFRFDGWKNEVSGEFINANTVFNNPDQIKLVPIFTRLNAGEALIALTRYLAQFILELFR